jgi:hypothetical protein
VGGSLPAFSASRGDRVAARLLRLQNDHGNTAGLVKGLRERSGAGMMEYS